MKRLTVVLLAVIIQNCFFNVKAYDVEFNIGQQSFKRCSISPNQKLLLVHGYDNSFLKIFDITTKKCIFQKNLAYSPWYCFFGIDSTCFFELLPNKITCYDFAIDASNNVLTPTKRYTIKQKMPLFNQTLSGTEDFIELNDTTFKKLSAYNVSHGTLKEISLTYDPELKTIIEKQNILPVGFWIHTPIGITLSFDGTHGAIAYTHGSSGNAFIHIINLHLRQTIAACESSYYKVPSLNFSPNNQLMIATLKTVYNRPKKYCCIIIDLQTHQFFGMPTKDEKYGAFAGFINDTTALVILDNGDVLYWHLTPETREQYLITDEKDFKKIDKLKTDDDYYDASTESE